MKGICQPRPPGFSLRKCGWGGGGRKGLFPSFSLSEGKGPGDEVEHMSLREKCKQTFVYESGSDDNLVLRENPRDEKGAKGETGRGESFPFLYFGAPLILLALQWLFAIIPNSEHFVLSSPTPRFQMRSSLSASGKPVTGAGKSLAKRRIHRLLNKF